MTTAPRPSGLDMSWSDPSIRPQDDLFGHVNGRWLDEHTIPADRSTDGAVHVLRDLSEERVREIIEAAAADGSAPADTPTGRIGALYRAFMDEESIEAKGAGPIAPLLEDVCAASTRSALTELMARPDSGTALIGAYVWTDDHDSTRYQVKIHQGGLGLPDESYYRDEAHAAIRTAYEEHLGRMADLAGLPGREGLVEGDGAAQARAVMDFETRLAECHVDIVRVRDRERSHNPMDAAARAEAAPSFDWDAYIRGSTAPADAFTVVSVGQPEFLAAADQLFAREELAVLRTWLAVHTVIAYAPYLSAELVAENFEFSGRVLSGAEELRERWKRGVALVEGAVGFDVGRQYVARHFPPEHKERMDDLVAALLEAYRVSIDTLDWMTPETRGRAQEKLAGFTPKVGYPDEWRSYDGLEIDPEDVVASVRASRRFDAAYEYAKVGGPIDEHEWHMTPQTVNAYYNPGRNEIVFPAAILQPPFFDAEADDAVNFGGIGAVIGHEIGHGFDDQGSKYDGEGNLRSWWTAEDRSAFEALTTRLVDQYAALSPRDLSESHHVNGELTIGENIGDLGGLSIAVKAYLATAARDGGDPPVLDGYTGLQRVFLSWATVWRGKSREQEAIRRLATDPHSPSEFRCNITPSHMAEFYDAFDVAPADGLYLAPSDRVRIW